MDNKPIKKIKIDIGQQAKGEKSKWVNVTDARKTLQPKFTLVRLRRNIDTIY